MPLKLRVISDQYKQLAKTGNSSRTFDASGGSIGRADDNDWVLPDQDRYVSSHHAKIAFRAGHWLLEDTSTNGVFVNDSDTPLSVTGPRKLKDGDRLRFGDYDIVVTIDEQSESATEATGHTLTPAVARNRTAKPGTSRKDHADYLRHGTFRSHNANRGRQDLSEDLGEELDITGLLVRADQAAAEQFDAVSEFDSAAEEARQRSTMATARVAAGGAAMPMTAPAERKPPPASPQPAPSGAVSLLGSLLEVDPASTVGKLEEDWHMSTRRLQARKPDAAPVAPPIPKAAPASTARLAPTPPAAAVTAVPIVREAVAAQRVEARSVTVPADALQGIDALCRGAGINAAQLPPDAQTALLTLAGQMLREVVLELTELQRSRGDQRARPLGGAPGLVNPLKTSASIEEALRRLLDGNSRSLGAVEALREAFTDIKNHQQASEAGIQAALDDLLTRVDPTELQERFDRAQKRNASTPPNKAKYWELYAEFYALLNQRDRRGWPAISSQEFTRVYDAKLEELNKRG